MRVSDSDVIEREADAEVAEPLHAFEHRAIIFERCLLGDFEHDPLRVDSVSLRLSNKSLAKLAAVAEDLGMDVHEENLPAGELLARSQRLTHARQLEIKNALLANRILEEHFRIAQKVIVPIARERFISED